MLTICFQFNCVLYGKWNHKIAATLAAMWTLYLCTFSQKFCKPSQTKFVHLFCYTFRMSPTDSMFPYPLFLRFVSLELCVCVCLFAFGFNGNSFLVCRSGWLKWQSGYWMPWETVSPNNNNSLGRFASYCSSKRRYGLQSKCIHEHSACLWIIQLVFSFALAATKCGEVECIEHFNVALHKIHKIEYFT